MKTKSYATNAILVVLLVACNLSSNAQLTSIAKKLTFRKKYRTLERAFTNIKFPYNNGGHTVNIDTALLCIASFSTEMWKNRIIDIEKTKLNNGTVLYPADVKPRMITTAEVFGGKDLLKWMEETIYNLDNTGGEKVGFKLAFGVYTEALLNFFNKYSDSVKQKTKRRDRITIFIIPCFKYEIDGIYFKPIVKLEESPYRRTINLKKYALKNSTTNKSQNFEAYELGGLQP